MRQFKQTKEAKIRALLKEGEEWESGRRGSDSKKASPKVSENLNQKLELQMISIRLPIQAVEQLKQRAAKNGIGYQPYLRQLVMEHLEGPSLEERVALIEKHLHLNSG